MKEIYSTPEMEVIACYTEDLICTSGDNELPFVPATTSENWGN